MPPPKDSIFSRSFFPLGFAVMGVGTVICSNYYVKRPFFAGIQRHIALAIAGGLFGSYLNVYFEKKWMKRDAVIRHYIELHPEDFKVEKRKYKEVFDEWYPMR